MRHALILSSDARAETVRQWQGCARKSSYAHNDSENDHYAVLANAAIVTLPDERADVQEYRQMCSNAQKAATSVLDQRDELYRKIVKWRDRVRTADHQEIVGLEDEMSAAVRKWEK